MHHASSSSSSQGICGAAKEAVTVREGVRQGIDVHTKFADLAVGEGVDSNVGETGDGALGEDVNGIRVFLPLGNTSVAADAGRNLKVDKGKVGDTRQGGSQKLLPATDAVVRASHLEEVGGAVGVDVAVVVAHHGLSGRQADILLDVCFDADGGSLRERLADQVRLYNALNWLWAASAISSKPAL